MLKLVALLSLVVGGAYGQAFPCPANHITAVTLGGNLPAGATNITTIPRGTNCFFMFDIPNNYALLLKFSADFQSTDDVVTIYDNTNTAVMHLSHTGQPIYDIPLWMSANSAMVQVVGTSGNSRFMLSYMYQSLADYQRVTKNTGEYFPLSSVTGKTYYTITASANEKVVLSYGQRAGAKTDILLSEYYVYDGDNINTATYIGSLSKIGSKITVASGRSVSIVNFYGTKSNAYALGNDASTVQGYSKYTIIMTSLGTQVSGNMTDLTEQGALYTFICTDCNNFLWIQNNFDSFATIVNKGYISFQGQTPTHRREKLIRYDAQTFTSNSLPQFMPANIVTVNLYLSRIGFLYNNFNDASAWLKPYHGRKGYIFAPNLWGTVNNNFNYRFQDDSQQFNFTMNFNKMYMPANTDQMTLKIGSGNTLAVDKLYPRDPANKVLATGNFMQVALAASVAADVRLAFEMVQKIPPVPTAPPTTTIQTTTSGASSDFATMLLFVLLGLLQI
ncbi:unnamed protein product [Caenorhabditis brenneri]